MQIRPEHSENCVPCEVAVVNVHHLKLRVLNKLIGNWCLKQKGICCIQLLWNFTYLNNIFRLTFETSRMKLYTEFFRFENDILISIRISTSWNEQEITIHSEKNRSRDSRNSTYWLNRTIHTIHSFFRLWINRIASRYYTHWNQISRMPHTQAN